MRFRGKVFAMFICAGTALFFLGLASAQTPGRGAVKAPVKSGTTGGARGGATVASAKVYGNLAQVMRGILFPNSNVIFFAQSKSPTDVTPAADPALATDPLAGTYGGWVAIENSSLALAEAANLLTIPGRVCSNGKPVPLKNPDWAKFVQGLRDAGMTAYKAAQAKDQDKVVDAADTVTTACQDCHDRYRDTPGGGLADRCM
jgi:hypothetical protein